ncbi:hypothetical protein DYH09_24835 [bacterium CPR1]|nr:hypothetical protein [bacterium CPR1]
MKGIPPVARPGAPKGIPPVARPGAPKGIPPVARPGAPKGIPPPIWPKLGGCCEHGQPCCCPPWRAWATIRPTSIPVMNCISC